MNVKGISLERAMCRIYDHIYGETLCCFCGKYRLVWQGPNAPWKMQVRGEKGWEDFGLEDELSSSEMKE